MTQKPIDPAHNLSLRVEIKKREADFKVGQKSPWTTSPHETAHRAEQSGVGRTALNGFPSRREATRQSPPHSHQKDLFMQALFNHETGKTPGELEQKSGTSDKNFSLNNHRVKQIENTQSTQEDSQVPEKIEFVLDLPNFGTLHVHGDIRGDQIQLTLSAPSGFDSIHTEWLSKLVAVQLSNELNKKVEVQIGEFNPERGDKLNQ